MGRRLLRVHARQEDVDHLRTISQIDESRSPALSPRPDSRCTSRLLRESMSPNVKVRPFEFQGDPVASSLEGKGKQIVEIHEKVLCQKRAMGFEPTTSSLGSWHSTTELRPQVVAIKGLMQNSLVVLFFLVVTLVATIFLSDS